MNDVTPMMHQMGHAAREAVQQLAIASDAQKNAALHAAAVAIRAQAERIAQANADDVKAARGKHLPDAFIDRLMLNESRIDAMAKGLEAIAAQPDPIGRELSQWRQPPHDLDIARISVPLGVIGVIYESRPNVTADAAGLCLKAGNAVILRGGSESLHSSKAIAACLHEGLDKAGLPKAAIQLVNTTDRGAVDAMLQMVGLIDVVIPRGGPSLTERVATHSRVPTLLHLDGNCHTYLHTHADPAKALSVTRNAKLRRTGICGATESLLVDEAVYQKLLPPIIEQLLSEGCQLRGDTAICALDARIEPASDEDWRTEYLDAILSMKVVKDIEEAIAHINRYGSHHTDAIITEDAKAAGLFTTRIDSAIVMVNTSTQFADGGEFGMGAEIGIATGRLHARGPVGAQELTTYKYIVRSNGAIRP